MKQAATSTLSGCVVWVIAFFMISMCILPIATMIGGFTSVTDFAIQKTGAIVCPENTTPDVRTYATTSTDSNGNRIPSTAYVLQCKNANGEVVMEDPVGYAFIWIGIWVLMGLIVTGVLCFIFAVPSGLLVTKLLERIKIRK